MAIDRLVLPARNEPDRDARVSASRPQFASPSFDEIYTRHFALLHRAARGFGVGQVEMDDVLQDVFLVVHRRLPTFDASGSVRAWLLQILINVVRERRRRYQRKGAGLVEFDEQMSGSTESPHDQVERAQAARILGQILDGLGHDRREVFVLSELEGVPIAEIAQAMGTNLNTTHSRLRLARKDYQAAVARWRAKIGKRT